MSYSAWNVHGYGIRKSDIDPKQIDIKALYEMIAKLPECERYIKESGRYGVQCADELIELLDDYAEDDANYVRFGIGELIAGLMYDYSDICLETYQGNDGEYYTVFPEKHPWCMTDAEKRLDTKTLDTLFAVYFEKITPQAIKPDFYDIYGGC